MRLQWSMFGVLLLVAWTFVSRSHSASEPLFPPSTPRSPSNSKFEMQGAGSCAAVACHNADAHYGFQGREYRIALERDFTAKAPIVKDKHAQAYAVLFNARSQQIVRNMKGPSTDGRVSPEREALCLRCHVHPEFERQPVWMHSDGVSCEACHGPAEHWLAEHFRPGFKELSAKERKAHGMSDTRMVAGRAQICVDCHVGHGGAEVNHDLVAAGHPRLNFEFSGFQHELHKHWDIAKDKDPTRVARGRKDFEARSWALGQIVAAEAALRLLAERAADERRPWIELAEYNCFACHHDLQPESWRQRIHEKGRAGKLTWSPWYYELLDDAVAALGPADPNLGAQLRLLTAEMEAPQPDRGKTAKLARQTAALLTALFEREQTAASPLPVESLLNKSIERADAKAAPSWDHAAPRYAAVAALARAGRDLGGIVPDLRPFEKLLRFPLGLDSPRDYDASEVESFINKLKQRIGK